MRIAQVAPLIESCPPKLYGGTERIVSYLTEELVCMGHDVTLFASGDSETSARLVAPCDLAIRLDPERPDPLAAHLIMISRIAAIAHRFDVLHFHTDYLHFPFFAADGTNTLTTLHGRLDLPHLPPVYEEFPTMPVVSISDAQRRPLPQANWQGTVYHGLPIKPSRMGFGDGGYLAFLGRICPEKGVDRAIEIARRTGVPLRIAAKVDAMDRAYFEAQIKPLLKDPLVDYIGEIDEREKVGFLGDALALLFPIDWPEPFGLALIESMANGTPVVAFPKGSVPEVIENGVTGYIVDSVEAAVTAVERAAALDRQQVRRRFEERFSSRRMTRDYLALYSRIKTRSRLPLFDWISESEHEIETPEAA